MKHSKDPFEAAAVEEEQEESPVRGRDGSNDGPIEIKKTRQVEEDERAEAKNKDENEDEEIMEVDFTKYSSGAYTVKKANKMQTILSQFTDDQMSRYESFRRSAFKKPEMDELLKSITGGKKPNDTTNIVVSGIAKMFVGELVETARVVMRERKESGPIRPCHIRESYRRLKLQGKVPKRSVPRLFH